MQNLVTRSRLVKCQARGRFFVKKLRKKLLLPVRLAPPRHCERSEAIQPFHVLGQKDGLLRRCAPRNDE
jgi:hypothetical protein